VIGASKWQRLLYVNERILVARKVTNNPAAPRKFSADHLFDFVVAVAPVRPRGDQDRDVFSGTAGISEIRASSIT